MTQAKRFLVYVASNHKGLESERYEVTRQLARMSIICCGFPCREDTSPYDWELARSQIEDSDLFIMILGDDYGPMAPIGISYLHRELVHAQSLSKPVLFFVKNVLPAKPQTEDQIRLFGFHGLISKIPFRSWHLKEELLSHVKTAVVNTLANKTGSWLKLDADEAMSASGAGKSTVDRMDNKQWALSSRQLMPMKFSAKVYEAGNNTLEEVSVSFRWEAIFSEVGQVMKVASSEDRLRSVLEKLALTEVKRHLLQQHPSSHAVDDVRINRQQFQGLLTQWSQHYLIESYQRGMRNTWQLTAEGARRIAVMKSAKQFV
jgi:hypothetical protein